MSGAAEGASGLAADAAAGSLLDVYDALLLDLDGTVYRGGAAIDGAVDAVEAAHARAVAVRFVTNNATRSPVDVAEHLTRLGIPAAVGEVSTSAQAAAAMLASRAPRGAYVLVVGTDALVAEVRTAGLVPVRTVDEAGGADSIAAVVQGLSQDTGWRDLAEAALAIRAGATWVACNVDPTLPTERGLLPGAGSFVAALRVATGAEPLVAGKPARPLMDEAIAAAGGSRPLVVGDRLDTDIAGASAVGADALLVLTGVSTPADLLAAPAEQRPRYVSADLRALSTPPSASAIGPATGWVAEAVDGGLLLKGGGGDSVAALRALCAAWWAGNDGAGPVSAEGDAASTALAELDL